jgi:hypothetical protein
MGSLHLEILEKMAHAISAIERASHDVVETEARLSIVDHVPEQRGEIRRCRSYSEHEFEPCMRAGAPKATGNG